MTEDEAKTKWCPMTLCASSSALTGNRFENVAATYPNQSARCIGTACMMWRQHVPHSMDPHPEQVLGHGYCGLAGKS